MVQSSPVKALKDKKTPAMPRDTPAPVRSGSLVDRLQTWGHSIWRRRWLSMLTAWLICLAGWATIALWPTSFVTSAVIHADLAALIAQNAAAEEPKKTPIAILRSVLLSDESLLEVGRQTSLDEAETLSLGRDLFLRSTVPPVFVLAYEHRDPDTAKQVLETVIANFRLRLDKAPEEEAAAREKDDLDSKINEQERLIEVAEADLIAFRQSNADVLDSPDERATDLAMVEEEVASLELELEATTVERDELAEQLAQARIPEPEVEPVEAELVRSSEELEAERTTLEAELANLRERYADSHPYVVAVLDTIGSLEAAPEGPVEPISVNDEADDEPAVDRDEVEQTHSDLIAEVSALKSRLSSKRGEIELLQALTQTSTSVEAELVELATAKNAMAAALADLQQRRDESGEADGGDAAEVGNDAKQEAFRLIKSPELPTEPVGPSRLVALAAVLIGGSGVGAATAIIVNRAKGVFESAWQLKRRFDVGVLGTISEVMTPGERRQLDYSRLVFGLAGLALIGTFSGLAFAEATDRLGPWGEHVRVQFLG